MKIELKRQNQSVHFEAQNESGNIIEFDGSASIGGQGKGMTPMEALLAAVAGCCSFDVVEILRKTRQKLDDIQVTISGDRKEVDWVKPFENMHIQFSLFGEVKEKKALQAIQLAVEKYCSVGASLDPKIPITYTFTINGIAPEPKDN